MIEIELLDKNSWQAFLSGLFFILVTTFGAWELKKKGFFNLPTTPSFLKIKGMDVIRGFGFVFSTEGIIFPFIYIWLSQLNVFKLNSETNIWMAIVVAFLGAFAALMAFYLLPKLQQKLLFKQLARSKMQSIKAGLVTLAIFYLPVMLISAVLTTLVTYLFGQMPKDQVAVEFIRQTKNHPIQFICVLIIVIILAPLKEEFLFRGLLQSWLKQKFHHRTAAIALASVIFALFHFASSQELSNIVLFCALFLVSCGLGFVFEKERSLWAPIAMHAGFNLSQVLIFIFLE